MFYYSSPKRVEMYYFVLGDSIPRRQMSVLDSEVTGFTLQTTVEKEEEENSLKSVIEEKEEANEERKDCISSIKSLSAEETSFIKHTHTTNR